MFRPNDRYFSVPPPSSDNWGPTTTQIQVRDDLTDDQRRLFGIELGKNLSPFEAACNVFAEDTKTAVWVSLNWLSDPVVLASKDLYLKTVELNTPLLDKDQFAARLLRLSEEKDEETGRYLIEAKDRLKALELYAKTQGFIDQPDDYSSKTFVSNTMKIVVVPSPSTQNKEPDNIVDLKPVDEEIKPLPLKLVAVR